MKIAKRLFCAVALLAGSTACFADSISSVVFTGSPANPTITIYGSGFGTEPAPTVLGFPGFTGYDYGNELYIEDLSPTHGFSAGRGFAPVESGDLIGLNILTYTDSKIVYTLGSDYALFYYPNGYYALAAGDSFEVVTDATYYGTVIYGLPTPEPATLIDAGTGICLVAVPALTGRSRRQAILRRLFGVGRA